jgi:predicted AAA+ superfamily ATPase
MRYIERFVESDLARKMVFVGGPRQTGKTHLARDLLRRTAGEYLNWDDARDRRRIKNHDFDATLPLIVFDELHKMARWKGWIKGVYDTRKSAQSYLVTGSARLDVYRRGGDSLLGRYHYWRLHPFTLDEPVAGISPAASLSRLMTVGGFPEPFLSGDVRDGARWRRERFDRILRDDVRDLENIRLISTLESLADLLKQRVGTQISFANLATDLEVAPKTVKLWIEILQRMYLLFVVPPYTGKLSRAIQRPPRIYFYDNMDVEVAADKQLGGRFENLVATHLLKRLQFREDYSGERWGLHYLRDRDDREVDFVITRNRQVEELIEVKYSDTAPSTSLAYYTKVLRPKKATQIVYELDRARSVGDVQVMSVLEYFRHGTPWDPSELGEA